MLDNIETVESCAKVDAVEDHLRDECIVDAGCLEDDCPIVKEVIGTGQLLQHLQSHS